MTAPAQIQVPSGFYKTKAPSWMSPMDRFWSKVINCCSETPGVWWYSGVRTAKNECWGWKGAKRSDGYVRFYGYNRKRIYAHVFAYEQLRGPVPDGLELDHLCRNRWCVNPYHLEAVSHQTNCRRGIARCSKLTHCKRGHALSGDNVYHHDGKRHCRACRSGRVRG